MSITSTTSSPTGGSLSVLEHCHLDTLQVLIKLNICDSCNYKLIYNPHEYFIFTALISMISLNLNLLYCTYSFCLVSKNFSN